MFQVGEVARQLGLNPQTLYFYERIGLIPSPQRTEAGYRLFSQQDVERLAFISRAKFLGLSLEEIKEILVLKDGRSLTCHVVYDRLQKKVEEIEATIRQLQLLRDELAPLVERCYENLQISDRECIVLDETNCDRASYERKIVMNTLRVEILGTGCKKCQQLEANARTAIAALNIEAEVLHITDPIEIAQRGVMSTPALTKLSYI
jgi:DNA-binding transcriptional MerR regulator